MYMCVDVSIKIPIEKLNIVQLFKWARPHAPAWSMNGAFIRYPNFLEKYERTFVQAHATASKYECGLSL